MDGQRRSLIFIGQPVAITLKEHQGTNRLTYGEVGKILSPGEFHPRGIKVRLKDGQVGRVQKILPQASITHPASLQQQVQKTQLLILLIENPEKKIYSRKLDLKDGSVITTLGIDLKSSERNVAEDVERLYSQVLTKIEAPKPFFNEKIELNGQQVHLVSYYCKGDDIEDKEELSWTWTGWLSREEIQNAVNDGMLSPESEMLFGCISYLMI